MLSILYHTVLHLNTTSTFCDCFLNVAEDQSHTHTFTLIQSFIVLLKVSFVRTFQSEHKQACLVGNLAV